MAGADDSRSFSDVWADSIRFVAPLLAPIVGLVALLIGGVDLLPYGLLAAALTTTVVTTAVAYFRYERGAGGFPRRRPIQPGDRVGGWLVVDHLNSAVRPDGTYLVRKGEEHGVLKVDYHEGNADRDPVRRAAREGEYLGRVKSSHVAERLDGASFTNYSFLVTRYLGDQTLWDRRVAGAVTDAEMYSIAAGSLKGLTALHDAGVIHRDLTPRNIMVDPLGAATLIDLGIAVADTTTRLTKTRAQIFTIGYKAPEQFRGPATAKSDVFVWASTMFFLVTGREAFPGDEAEAQGRITSGPPDLSTCPQWLQPALSAGFTTNPDSRSSAAEALGILSRAKHPDWTVRVARASVPERQTRTPSWAAPSAVTVALALAAATIALQALDASRGSPNGPTADEPVAESAVPDTEEPTETDVISVPLSEPPVTEPSTPTTATPTSTTTTTTSTSTTSTTLPPAPVERFLGVWHGAAIGADNTVSVAFVIDVGTATAEGAPVGSWAYNTCSGPLRLVSATDDVLALSPIEADPDCGFGGSATLVRSGDSAAYDWSSDDGGASRTGTFSRTGRIPLADPGWPTGKNEASSAFFAGLGVCATGASGCSESGQFPSWSSCTTDNLCIVGGGAPVVDVWRSVMWVLEISESVSNSAVALLAVGFSEDQVVDLLGL